MPNMRNAYTAAGLSASGPWIRPTISRGASRPSEPNVNLNRPSAMRATSAPSVCVVFKVMASCPSRQSGVSGLLGGSFPEHEEGDSAVLALHEVRGGVDQDRVH